MRLLFVNWAFDSHGSAQDVYHYARAARGLGHEVAIHGPPKPGTRFDYSLEVDSADAVVFIFEFSTWIARLHSLRFLSAVPRRRRVVLDLDGKYNDPMSAAADVNHRDHEASKRWIETCDSLSDKVFQPTLHPSRPNVGSFLFHGYHPGWETPLDFGRKQFGMVYVGNNWFRWGPLRSLLEVIEPIRDRIGRLGLVGNGWKEAPARRDPDVPDAAYDHDPDYLERMGVEVGPPVAFNQVIDRMSRGMLNPVLLRPLFDRLGLVTCRTFETPAANTIPLFRQEAVYLEELYGDAALELALPDQEPQEKILDILGRPNHYARLVAEIREHLRRNHSYESRVKHLVEIVES